MNNPVPVLSYLRRYWWIVLITIGLWFLPGWDQAFAAVGMLVYVPAAALTVAVVALLCRHLVNRTTTDQYRASGQLAEDWKVLPQYQRIWVFKIELWVWLIALAIVVHAILG